MKYPEKIDRLILIDSSGLNVPDKSEWRFLNYPVIGEIITNFISLDATYNSLSGMVYEPSFITKAYAEEIFAPLSKPNNRKAQYLSQRNMDWKITDARLGELEQEILLIFGEFDPYFDNNYYDEMMLRLQNANLVVVKQTGHLPHEERPDEVNALMLDFLTHSENPAF